MLFTEFVFHYSYQILLWGWDNTKKNFEPGEFICKHSEAHKENLYDTVRDHLKRPSLNILINLMMIVSLFIVEKDGLTSTKWWKCVLVLSGNLKFVLMFTIASTSSTFSLKIQFPIFFL